jgi:hypothetical protein
MKIKIRVRARESGSVNTNDLFKRTSLNPRDKRLNRYADSIKETAFKKSFSFSIEILA